MAGAVFVAHGKTRRAVSGVWVTLHRIGADTAAPVDSIRTGARGAFLFRYRPTGDTAAVYIVAGQYAGIAYYSAPLRAAVVSGADADLIVYDTASVGVPVKVASHHVIVGAADTKRRREVIEVIVLTNAGDITRVANPVSPTFMARLSPDAADPQASDGEVPPDAMTFAGGIVRVTAPIAPGTKRLSYTYTLPAREPIIVSSVDSAGVLELLVEDAGATVEGTVVREDAPTTVSGRTFKRYSGQNVATTDGLRIIVSSGRSALIAPATIIALAIAVAMGIILVLTVRAGGPLVVGPKNSASLASPGNAP